MWRGGGGFPHRRTDAQQLQVRPHVQTYCTGRPTGHSALGVMKCVYMGASPALTLIDDVITLI